MPETKRTYIIDISRSPSISGYGGWDSWEIGPLTSDQAELLLKRLDSVIENYKLLFNVGGGYTGSQ